MPNWCEGILKIRGTQTNIKNFLEENLVQVDFEGNEKIKFKFEKAKDYCYTKEESEYWLKNSNRAFMIPEDICLENKEEKQIILCNFKQGWDIDVDLLLNHAEKYNLDFKIYAFERGGEFNRDIEVINGKITKDETIKFENYQWECPCPDIGG